MHEGDRYTVISSDCHGGADVLEYRDFLDPAYLDEFDAWASGYEPPYEDLKGEQGSRNWDSARRLAEMDADGVVAEVLFPNTVAPFFSVCLTGCDHVVNGSADFWRRWAGLRAHNRWLAEFCGMAGGRRAGVFQVMLHDIDEAVKEVKWAAAAGLRGGMLLPGAPPGSGLPPLYYHEYYGPLWRACADAGIPVNCHSGSASPRTGDLPEDHVLFLLEMGWWDKRTLRHLILGGVLEQNPGLRVVFTEEGLGWIPAQLEAMDSFVDSARASASVQSELTYAAQVAAGLSLRPSEYWQRQCYAGASFLHPSETSIRDRIGVEKIMWGSDYPHVESTYPYSKSAIGVACAALPADDVARILAGNAAEVFGFDLAKLAPIASRVGPRREEVAAGVDLAALPPGVVKCPAFAGLLTGANMSRWGDNRKTDDRMAGSDGARAQ